MEFLIIVDAQNDFITGKLAAPGAKEVVKNICHEVKQTSAFPIVTQDIHDQGEYALSVEGKTCQNIAIETTPAAGSTMNCSTFSSVKLAVSITPSASPHSPI